MVVVKNDLLVEYNFGICYERGFGVERDMFKVGIFYKFVVEYGYIGVQYNVGVFFEYGFGGFVVDKREVVRFYRMVVEVGDEDVFYNFVFFRKLVEIEKLAKQIVKF